MSKKRKMGNSQMVAEKIDAPQNQYKVMFNLK